MEQSAGAVIEHNGNYLVIQGRNGKWGFPKGHLELDETPAQAALREAKEEVGLDITLNEQKTHVIEYTLENGDTKRVTHFLAHAKINHVVNNPEVLAFKWLSANDVLQQLSFDSLRETFTYLTKRK